MERVMENGAGAFGGETATPVVRRQTPSDFYCGGEVGCKGGGVEADVADEGSGFCELGGVGAVAVKGEVLLDAGDEGVGFLGGEGGGVELHYSGVGVYRLEGEAVGIAPGAEG